MTDPRPGLAPRRELGVTPRPPGSVALVGNPNVGKSVLFGALTGRYVDMDEHTFTLERYKINCCVADAISLKLAVLAQPNPDDPKDKLDRKQLRGQWVKVTGRVYFLHRQGSGEFLPALVVFPKEGAALDKSVELVAGVDNPYEN